jgi:hypothetical protein
MKDEIDRWEIIRNLITFQTKQYGGLLKQKDAIAFHYVKSEANNDYANILESHHLFRPQSFRWRMEEDEKDDGVISISKPISLHSVLSLLRQLLFKKS